MDYFANCKTEQETKTAFRHLSKILHPDIGGDHFAFIEMENSYQAKLRSLHGTYNSMADADAGKNKYQYDFEIEQDLMLMVRALQGLRLPETCEIHIQGTWIWVKGTIKNGYGHYPLKPSVIPMLEKLGLKHHTMKGECYYRDSKNRCQNKGKIMKFDRIAAKYRGGSVSNTGSDQIN